MTGQLVTDIVTPLSLEDGIGSLAGGFRLVMRSEPPPECLAVLGAQVCLETGNFRSMHRFNPGNVKKPTAWDGLYTRFRCDEIFDAVTTERARKLGPCSVSPWKGGPLFRVVLVPPHPWTEFIAFNTALEGMEHHVELLSLNDRYRPAWSRAYAGDAVGTAEALHRAGYFTADLAPYARGMAQLTEKLRPICAALLGAPPLITDAAREEIQQLVNSTMAQARWGIGDSTEPSRPPGAAA